MKRKKYQYIITVRCKDGARLYTVRHESESEDSFHRVALLRDSGHGRTFQTHNEATELAYSMRRRFTEFTFKVFRVERVL